MRILAAYEHLLTRYYGFESRADERHSISCDDDACVVLKRFVPRPFAPRRNLPVICVPGLGADSHNFDAPGPWGLGPALAEQGFDTWIVDLRGTGQSHVDKELWCDITFDDFVERDLPAALDYVCERTGAGEVLWIGHSMGGMVLYASFATGRAHRVRAAITLGAPIGFPQGWDCVPLFRHLHFLTERVPGLHVRRPLRWLAPWCMSARDVASRNWIVHENCDAALCRRLLYAAVQDIPRGVALQFRDWIHHDAFRSFDLSLDYRARMAGTTTPVLVVCGPEDKLGVPCSVERAKHLLPNAEWLELGRAQGFSTDYGHVDMVFGKRAPEEVFPRFFSFLAKHDEGARERSVATRSRAPLRAAS